MSIAEISSKTKKEVLLNKFASQVKLTISNFWKTRETRNQIGEKIVLDNNMTLLQAEVEKVRGQLLMLAYRDRV